MEKCIFVGYPKETIGYTFYNPTEGKFFVAKYDTFLEKEFLAKGISGRKVQKMFQSYPPQWEKEHMMMIIAITLRKIHAGL
jgi:hypothetical protein